MTKSIWTTGAPLPAFPALKEDIKTDVLIIGGGLCGVLCAYFLKQKGADCVVAEADCLGGGVTQNTTAKITAQHGLFYDKLIRKAGRDAAQLYADANRQAVAAYRALAAEIAFDFEEKDAYTYTLTDRRKIEDEVRAASSLGIQADFADALPLPFATEGAVRFTGQAQCHPLKLMAGIAKNLTVYEHTPVRAVQGRKALTDHGTVTAGQIIVATHFPFINRHGAYFIKLYQHRSYVLALENAPAVNGMYIDEAKTGLSFRNYQNYLLLGGGGHRTGKKSGGWEPLRRFAEAHYPDSRVAYSWATQDCMSLDGMPYIGPYGRHTPGLYAASGFNKWGMTGSMVAAQVLSDIITGRKNDYAALFDPARSMMTRQLPVNGLEAVANLLTPLPRRCPHMGCALKWNPDERTWDCPCHGSRFEQDGTLINNPATKDAKTR
ncbi:MAG: FAD-dependent oxidoreductase [Clostridia bacterium]